MLVLEQIRHGISFKTVWYATERLAENGIIHYREAQFKDGSEDKVFSTFVSDLTVSEQEITQCYTKNCRYKINRAPREGVTCNSKCGNSLTENDLKRFIRFYVTFWESKGITYSVDKQASLMNELKLYLEEDALCISEAILDGETLVYHTYVTDGIHARLWHSASLYRQEDTGKSNVVGMANRYLHKYDMLMFKEMGFEVYDWGGAGISEDVKHITEFKASFGGTPKDYYEYYEVKGIKANLFIKLAKLLGK